MSVRNGFLLISLAVLMATAAWTTGNQEEVGTGESDMITVTTVANIGGSVRYFGDDTTEDNVFTEFLREEFGINVEYLWITQGSMGDFSQRLNLSILSGEVPDMFSIGNVNTYQDYARAGHLLEVKSIFDELANGYLQARIDVQDGVLWRAFAVDGRNYSIPIPKFLYQDNKTLWIRQDWLDALGLDAPTTIEEMYEVARAFTFDDPDGNGLDDTIGFGFDNGIMSWMASLDPFFGAYGAMPGTWLKGVWVENENGDLVYPIFLGDAKGALSELAAWYAEGIINVDFVTQAPAAVVQLIGGGTLGMYFGSPWNPDFPHPDTFANVPGSSWRPYPLPAGPNGDRRSFNTPIVGGAGHVFSADFEHLDRIIEYFNHWTETVRTPGRGVLESEYALGTYYELNDEGRVMPIPDRSLRFSWSINNPQRYTEMVAQYDAGNHERLKDAYDEIPIENWSDLQIFESQPEYIAALRLVVDAAPRTFTDQFQAAVPGPIHERTWSFLRDLEIETISRIIMGELPVSAFDDFRDQWLSSGGAELAEEINEWWRLDQ